MNQLEAKPNDESGFWEIHDESGFLCELESESTAESIVKCVNALDMLVAALEATLSAYPPKNYRKRGKSLPPALEQQIRVALRTTNK